MAGQIPISLEPLERIKSEAVPTLGQDISRITQERGSFAKLDEDDLARDNAASESPKATAEGSEMEVEADSSKTEASFDELRAQLAAKVGAALNETALNLDFVSLLVSGSRPQAGESSMSPMLKSQAPAGSLNAEGVSTVTSTTDPTSSYGWKVRAYGRSAENMQAAAERLAAEARKEATFWSDVLTATSEGEVINRKLRVTYGYHDSGSAYFDKGKGSLARDEVSGHAIFHPAVATPHRLLRVSIFADGNREFESEAAADASKPGSRNPTPQPDSTVSGRATPEPERLIGRAVLSFKPQLEDLAEPVRSIRLERNNLFEHELMYELIQEARGGMAPHRIKLCDGGNVVCELFGGRIELEMVDGDSEDETEDTARLALTNPAQAINYAIHLLLTERYKTRLEHGHDIPKPLSSRAASPKGKDSPKVLQPVLAHIHHSILVGRTTKLIQVMLPKASVTVKESQEYSLLTPPKCVIEVDYGANSFTLDVGSPVSNADEPMVVASTSIKRTEIFDLTELELWLKWANKSQN